MEDKQRGDNREIDIIDLICSLWQQKWLILLITFFGIAAAITYLAITTPIYEAQALISPPTLSDIEGFNYGRSKSDLLPPFSVNDTYDIFTKNILAESTKRQFFNDVFLQNLPKEKQINISENMLFNQFSRDLSISGIQNTTPTSYRVFVKNYDPAQAAKLLKQYIEFTNKIATGEILEIIKSQSEHVREDLELKINMSRNIAKAKRYDRLAILNEALNIAKATENQNQVVSPKITITDTALNTPSMMYLRGSKALESEVENLTKRISDDPFIPKMHQMQEYYNLYKNIRIRKNVAIFRLDGEIKTPEVPESPKKRMILIRSTLLAFVLAVALASFRHAFGRRWMKT